MAQLSDHASLPPLYARRAFGGGGGRGKGEPSFPAGRSTFANTHTYAPQKDTDYAGSPRGGGGDPHVRTVSVPPRIQLPASGKDKPRGTIGRLRLGALFKRGGKSSSNNTREGGNGTASQTHSPGQPSLLTHEGLFTSSSPPPGGGGGGGGVPGSGGNTATGNRTATGNTIGTVGTVGTLGTRRSTFHKSNGSVTISARSSICSDTQDILDVSRTVQDTHRKSIIGSGLPSRGPSRGPSRRASARTAFLSVGTADSAQSLELNKSIQVQRCNTGGSSLGTGGPGSLVRPRTSRSRHQARVSQKLDLSLTIPLLEEHEGRFTPYDQFGNCFDWEAVNAEELTPVSQEAAWIDFCAVSLHLPNFSMDA